MKGLFLAYSFSVSRMVRVGAVYRLGVDRDGEGRCFDIKD